MMNDIIFISQHPNTPEKEQQVMECVESLKCADKEIILTTHCPVSVELQKMVDYFVYDSNNYMITDWEDFSTWYWSKGNINFAYILQGIGPHQIANMTIHRNGLTMAKALGKDLVYYFEGDSSFDDSDRGAFDYIKNEMNLKNRKAYFEIEQNKRGTNSFNCKLEMFVGDPNFLLNSIDFVDNSKDYFNNVRERQINDEGESNEIHLTTAMESYYYDYLSEKNSHTRKPPVEFSILKNSDSFNYKSNLYPNIKLNLHTKWDTDIELGNHIFFTKETHIPAIISCNKTKQGQDYRVIVKGDDSIILDETYSLLPNEKFFRELPKCNSYEVEFQSNGNTFFQREFTKELLIELDKNNSLPWWSTS